VREQASEPSILRLDHRPNRRNAAKDSEDKGAEGKGSKCSLTFVETPVSEERCHQRSGGQQDAGIGPDLREPRALMIENSGGTFVRELVQRGYRVVRHTATLTSYAAAIGS
jgi:hypothetical protein